MVSSTAAAAILLFFTVSAFHCISMTAAFVSKSPSFRITNTNTFSLHSEAPSSSSTIITTNPNVKPSDEWELDCYSRPVMVDGKKLWEVLITDSTGSFRLCETLPSNKVNSRELRRVVDEAIENAQVKPNIVRFFRGAMFNMVS
jgi:hypothetical protein